MQDGRAARSPKEVKADKKSKAELTVKSPFTKRVRESPLPRIYKGVGDL